MQCTTLITLMERDVMTHDRVSIVEELLELTPHHPSTADRAQRTERELILNGVDECRLWTLC